VLGSMDIFLRSEPGVDPYFCFLMSDPLVGWQEVWFFLRNDADVPLPCSWLATPSLNPNGGMVWPRKTSTGYKPCVRSFSG
jgi:hypothetical protein